MNEINTIAFFLNYLDLVSESSRSKAASDWGRARGGSKFKDSTLAIGTSGDDTNISWVLNGSNGTSCQQDLLPGLFQIDDVDTCQERVCKSNFHFI